jgi:hypothetical protein
MVARDEEDSAQWTLNALAQAARSSVSTGGKECAGVIPIVGATVQIRILSAMEPAVVCHYTQSPEESTTVCTDELGQ